MAQVEVVLIMNGRTSIKRIPLVSPGCGYRNKEQRERFCVSCRPDVWLDLRTQSVSQTGLVKTETKFDKAHY